MVCDRSHRSYRILIVILISKRKYIINRNVPDWRRKFFSSPPLQSAVGCDVAINVESGVSIDVVVVPKV